jgi:hypothetical protein
VSTFEIQVYKSGIWNVDSYFDDRDIAMSEAERLEETGRHAAIRVLQEDFDESSNKSQYRVVFSKSRQSEADQDWREQSKRASVTRTTAANGGRARPSRQRSSPKKGNAGLYIGIVVAFMVLVAGAAAMIGLQEIAKYL